MSPRGGSSGKPTPGTEYVAQEDTTLDAIATQAGPVSGKSLINGILRANSPRPGNKVHIGEKVIIPGAPPAKKLKGKEADDLTIIVDGIELPMLNAKIITTIDTASDAWAGRIAWTPGESAKIDKATRPFGYPRAAAYIGNQLMVSGRLYTVSPEMTDKGLTQELIGYSFTIDAVDSSVFPPYAYSNVTFKQLARMFANALGINAVFAPGLSAAFLAPFDTAEMRETETIFQFLSRLTAQRGGLLSNTPDGDMLFLQANTSQKTVGTLQEGDGLVTGWKATYDGRKRFNKYQCITAGMKGRQPTSIISSILTPGGTTPKVGPPVKTAEDPDVPLTRVQTFRADNVTPGNIIDSARWRKNKQFVDALTIPFPVTSWYAPNGSLWAVNTLVNVISPTLGVSKGYTFLVRSVEFDMAEKSRSAMLHLIPPNAYTQKDLGDIWT